MKKNGRTEKRKAALVALREKLEGIAADLAPVPASAEGCFLEPDFRHASVALPTVELDNALSHLDGQDREELTRRGERMEKDWSDFVFHRRRFRRECAEAGRATRGELGELSDPAGKFRTFRRNIIGDVDFLNGLLGGKEAADFIGYNGGISQTEFAALMGKSVKSVKRWEKGSATPSIFDPQAKKEIRYSAEIRHDRMTAATFALYYHRQEANKQGIENATRFIEGETERVEERKRRGIPPSTAKRKADYDGEPSAQLARMAYDGTFFKA